MLHPHPVRSLQSIFRSRWKDTAATSTSTPCRFSTNCINTPGRPALHAPHVFPGRTQASVEGRRSNSRTASSIEQRPPLGFSRLLIGALLFGGAYTIGSAYPPSVIDIISPRPAPASPLDDSPEANAKQREVETALWALPQVQARLKTTRGPRPDSVPLEFRGPFQEATPQVPKDWTHYIVRPYFNVPPHIKQHSLTAGLFQGAGRIVTPPLAFVRSDEQEMETYLHVGRSLCGHDGIVHGGFLATILDEAMARMAAMNLDARVGVTANLTINYRAPTRADQFIVIKTRLGTVKGRRAEVSARIEDLEGRLLVESSSIFVQPKYAHLLRGHLTNKILGIPDDLPQEEEKTHTA